MKKILFAFLAVLSVGKAHSQNWKEIIKKAASDRAADDYYGWSVAVSGNYAIVGADAQDYDTAGANYFMQAGAAYICEKSGTGNWIEKQKLVASDRKTGGLFGYSVAMSANYAVVGARSETHDTLGGNIMAAAGAVYVFERNLNGKWIEKQKLVASDRASGDQFGYSVSISGNYLIVGAYNEAEDILGANTLVGSGSAYVFERNTSGKWIQVKKLVALDRAAGDNFGNSVSISNNYAVVGAYNDDALVAGQTGIGSSYVFERDINGKWMQKIKLVASDRANDDQFGVSVSISGNYIIVGADHEDEAVSGGNTLSSAGSAYIFERNTSGIWLQQQKIVASDRDANDSFGFRVSLSGNNAIVGAWKESEDENGGNTLGSAGSSYIFERNSNGNWNQKQKLVASDRGAGDSYGYAISISGSTAFVGAPLEDNDVLGGNFLNTAGSVYVYCLSNTSTINVSACVSYTSPSGNVYTSSNTYIDTISNVAGCDSIITIQLTIKPLPNVTTSLNSLTITANQTGATYQWFNCDSNQFISNATNQSYTVTANGNYAVIVSVNGCSDTSACVNINSVGILESINNNSFNLYPNPNSGTFIVESKADGLFSLCNSLGQEVKAFYLNAENKYTVNIDNVDAGIYYIFESNNNYKTFKKKVVIIK